MFFMKINKTNKVFQVYEDIKAKRVNADRKQYRKDQFKASERAVDYQFAINKLREVPDIRKDKVERIKAQVQSGSYNVEGKEIAEKILEGLYIDRKV
ncbi:anti-sigma-28 factor, FlgM family [Tepidimicrobium xylanilyticum]|uniref:Negative regulator of flagellin synthesis n=2 Tax=Tepidimicrobium xylanilyticum TaxID=1123352 RepID=A0A1H2QVB1_9FIRM|nr:anti-sigma-28 factor, FlgM family [Tepidimicrobium xylanilyticum]